MSGRNLKYVSYRFSWGALDLLFPPSCAGCGRFGIRWCAECQNRVVRINGTLCEVCGLPQDAAGICEACKTGRPHFRALRAWAAFEEPVRSALHKLKYRRDMSLGDSLAAQMIVFVQELCWPIDLALPVPLGRQRLKERGYNQVAMIARPLALALDIQYAPNALIRRKETRSQVGLSMKERQENVHQAFVADASVKRKTVLVIDDVSTTGSTLSSSAEALLSSGANDVYALAVARALKLEHA